MRIILLGVILLFYFNNSACTCIGNSTVEAETENSDLIAVGTVLGVKKVKIWGDTTYAIWKYNPEIDSISLEEYKFNEKLYGFHLLEYSIAVERSFKGAVLNDTIKVWTGFGNGDCGFRFSVGKKYLVYAKDEYKIKHTQKKLGRSKKELKGVFRTNICFRTAPLSNSESDLVYLNKRYPEIESINSVNQ